MSVRPISIDKKSLRRRYVAARQALTAAQRAAKNNAISAHLAAFLAARRPDVVALYVPHQGEVDVRSLAVDFDAALPVIQDAGAMTFKSWRPGNALVPNRYAILEPEGGDPVTFTERSVILVPSVALDRRGGRLGYGGGFYDRALQASPALAIGVTYECCLADVLPLETHDVRLAGYVTERGFSLLAVGS
jgi:5-formyltetrahydrofolate cyclo-ligase